MTKISSVLFGGVIVLTEGAGVLYASKREGSEPERKRWFKRQKMNIKVNGKGPA